MENDLSIVIPQCAQRKNVDVMHYVSEFYSPYTIMDAT
jgi:hypothetical protein